LGLTLIEARDSSGETAIFYFLRHHKIALRLLARGASANVTSSERFTPLTLACYTNEHGFEVCPELVSALLRASSPGTRRARDSDYHDAALGRLISYDREPDSPEPRRYALMREMLAAGVPVKPGYANLSLRRGGAVRQQVGGRRSPSAGRRPMTWRGHEGMVRLAFDFRDAREAEERLRATEGRIEELENELAELGVGTESDDEEEEQGGSRGKEEEGASASGSGPLPERRRQ
jgi:hypothetical protein